MIDTDALIVDLPCHAPCGVTGGKCGNCVPCKAGKALRTLTAENARLEGLLGQVWDINRDRNRDWHVRVKDTMNAIREKP